MRLSVVVLVIAVFFPRLSSAWVYQEHQEIISAAHIKACQEFRQYHPTDDLTSDQTERYSLFCSPEVALCHGHFAAYAADKAKTITRFTRDLENGMLDIRNSEKHTPLNPAEITSCTGKASEFIKPLQWGVVNFRDRNELGDRNLNFHVLRAIATNDSHFIPDAVVDWKEYFLKTHAAIDDKKPLHEALRYSGFAMHFLSDSFAAGHNGLIRAERLQAEHRTHHDTYNKDGIFLQADGESWFTYGDSYLYNPHYYLEFDSIDTQILNSILEELVIIDDNIIHPVKDSDLSEELQVRELEIIAARIGHTPVVKTVVMELKTKHDNKMSFAAGAAHVIVANHVGITIPGECTPHFFKKFKLHQCTPRVPSMRVTVVAAEAIYSLLESYVSVSVTAHPLATCQLSKQAVNSNSCTAT